MSEYTKGPWNMETVPTTAGSCHKIGPFPSIGVRPQVHACVYADGIRIGLDENSPVAVELLANACLISSAPDLLEALIGLVGAADDVSYGYNTSQMDSYIEVARSAIAKATSYQKGKRI